MVNGTEVEIGLTVIQLTGVVLPILAGTTGYYLIHKEKIDKLFESHDEVLDDASIVEFLENLYIVLLLSYFSAAVVVLQDMNLLLIFSITCYGVFLLFAIMGLLIVIDASLAHFAKSFMRSVVLLLVISVLLIILLILVSFDARWALGPLGILVLLILRSTHKAGLIDRNFFSRFGRGSEEDDSSEEDEELN